jgi:hypothetical protein
MTAISVRRQGKYWFFCVDFYETHKRSTEYYADILYQISFKSDNKCGTYEELFIHTHTHTHTHTHVYIHTHTYTHIHTHRHTHTHTHTHTGSKTFFYVVRQLDSIAFCLPTGVPLGFFRSWSSLFPLSSFSSVFLVLSLFWPPFQCYFEQSSFCHSLNVAVPRELALFHLLHSTHKRENYIRMRPLLYGR